MACMNAIHVLMFNSSFHSLVMVIIFLCVVYGVVGWLGLDVYLSKYYIQKMITFTFTT